LCVSLGLKKPGDFTVSEGHGHPLVWDKRNRPKPYFTSSMIFLLRFCTTPARTPLAYNAPDLYTTASSSLIHLPFCLIHCLFVCCEQRVMTSFFHLAHLHKEPTHKSFKTSFWRELRISPTHKHTHTQSINQDLLSPKCKSNVVSPLCPHM
jgi:hypothetical protein